MKADRLHEFGKPLVLEEAPLPRVEGDEVLVRVHGAGVCHTDLHIADGSYWDLPLPRVLGHEISGFAEGIGDVLVYASWGVALARIAARARSSCARRRPRRAGCETAAMPSYVRVPSRRYLLPLQGLDPIRAAPLADAGVTPLRAVRRIASGLAEEDRAVLIGIGGLGQFGLQYLRI